MKQILAVLGLSAIMFAATAWADEMPGWTAPIVNEFGSVTITNAGIVSRGSELVGFNGIKAPKGHSLGSVSFSTGALISGSIFGGGAFSASGSSFVVKGVGHYGEPKGIIFDGSFVGPIAWKVVSHTGKYEYVFRLSGSIEGTLWNGHMTVGTTTQTIVVNQNQWIHDHKGSIRGGSTNDRLNRPEPGTLALFGTGLMIVAGIKGRKFLRA